MFLTAIQRNPDGGGDIFILFKQIFLDIKPEKYYSEVELDIKKSDSMVRGYSLIFSV